MSVRVTTALLQDRGYPSRKDVMMSTDNDLALIIRNFFRFLDPGETLDAVKLAKVIVSEFQQLGDYSRTVAGVSALIRVEAAASGVSCR